jgi:UDPglucose 6-dehydrogenase
MLTLLKGLNKMTSLGIIGGGVLGRAVARGFMEHADVRVYDVVEERSTHRYLEDVATAAVVICLPTPPRPDGTCDTTALDDFLHTAYAEEYWRKDSCYIIRSTVPIGYTQAKAEQYLYGRPLFHSPEFLTARCAVVDFQTPARNILGGLSIKLDQWTPEYAAAWERAVTLYQRRFPGVPLVLTTATTSELVKLATNSFFAAKVSLFNLFHEVATAHGLEWQDVLAGILTDGRIAHAHTAVPGPDGQYGFGGTCLPKDLADLWHCATTAGVDAALLRAVLERNAATRGPDEKLAKISLPKP